MASFGTYYIDSNTFAGATGVYIDASLTTGAPDGYYSDGIITRLQTAGVLSRSILCPECNPPCSSAISGSASTTDGGVYYLNFDAGNSLGAIIITLTPTGTFIPVGLTATYDSGVYNSFSSVNDGFLGGTPTNAPTYVGDTAATCSPFAGVIHTEDEFEYDVSSGLFVSTGTQLAFGISASQVQTTTGTPGACVMAIPKINPSPNTVALAIFAPCASTTFSIDVACPALLTSFDSTTLPVATSSAACSGAVEGLYYNVPVTGIAGSPNIHDIIYTDAYAQQRLSNAAGPGYYKWDDGTASGAWFEIDSNSVIINTGSCP